MKLTKPGLYYYVSCKEELLFLIQVRLLSRRLLNDRFLDFVADLILGRICRIGHSEQRWRRVNLVVRDVHLILHAA